MTTFAGQERDRLSGLLVATQNDRDALRGEIMRLRAALKRIADDRHSQWSDLVDIARRALEEGK